MTKNNSNSNGTIAAINKSVKMTSDESFEKRIKKNGEFRTDKFKVSQFENIIRLCNEWIEAKNLYNATKNVNGILSKVKKTEMSNADIDALIAELNKMKN